MGWLEVIPYKTISQQKLEHLQSLRRPLSDEESDELRRAMHAVYVRDMRIKQQRNEELRLLKKVEAESKQREWYPNEVQG